MKQLNSAALSSLRRLLVDIASHMGVRGAETVAFVLLGALLEGTGILLLVPFLSLVIDAHAVPTAVQRAMDTAFSAFSATTRVEKLGLLIGVFVALMLIRAFVIVRRDSLIVRLESTFISSVRSRLTHKLAAADWAVTSRLRHSRIAHFMGADMQQLSNATYFLCHDTVSIVLILSQAAIAFYLSPVIATIAVIVIVVGAFTLPPILERARRFGEFVANANLSLVEDTGQFLAALKLAISQNLQKRFTTEFDATLTDLAEQQVSYARRMTVMRQIVTTASSLVGVCIVVLGIAVFNVQASVLITLLILFSRINSPATQIYLEAQHLMLVLPVYERITALEAELTAMTGTIKANGSQDGPPSGGIRFEDVSFLYEAGQQSPSERGGIRSLSIEIERGSIVGITGPSGAGKTTFADILVGLYPPQSGKLFVGGMEISGDAVTGWRNQISYVAQDPFLFHDTIRRNLLWSSPSSSETDLWAALEFVDFADFVRRAPQGLDTIVGERGSLMSGGERQRINLARAILRKPRLLLLDEATNAIDIDGEKIVLDRLAMIVPRPTIVIVAHRAESLRTCERILRFDSGRIVADERNPAAPEPSRLRVRGATVT